MAACPRSRRSRSAARTKAERSAATRVRLLDATIDCLVELGWSGTSTTEVVRRAGVSRGAQVHHYPTKEDLVLAAVEHLCTRRMDEYRAALERLPAHERTPAASIDLLWSVWSGPTLEAWLELVVACRTQPALRERFVEFEHRFFDAAVALFRGDAAGDGRRPGVRPVGTAVHLLPPRWSGGRTSRRRSSGGSWTRSSKGSRSSPPSSLPSDLGAIP